MSLKKMILCFGLLGLLISSTSCGNNSFASSQIAPPNIRVGVKVNIMLANNGYFSEAEIKEIRGNWARVRVNVVGDDREHWVNFDNVVFYDFIFPKK